MICPSCGKPRTFPLDFHKHGRGNSRRGICKFCVNENKKIKRTINAKYRQDLTDTKNVR